MQVTLPPTLSSSHLRNLLKIEARIGIVDKIVLDWTKTTDIEVSGHAILSSLCDLALESGTKIVHKGLAKELVKARYNPIFDLHLFDSQIPARVHFRESQNELNMRIDGGYSTYFAEYFSEKFRYMPEGLIFHAKLILNELLQNATDHSGSERYYLYGKITDSNLLIGVLDSGVGIPHKLAQKYKKASDEDYIEYSFKRGISTRRLRTGGYGLYHTFSITKNYDGNLVMLSQNGGIRRYFAQRKVVRLKLDNTLRGTWCFVDIKHGTDK